MLGVRGGALIAWLEAAQTSLRQMGNTSSSCPSSSVLVSGPVPCLGALVGDPDVYIMGVTTSRKHERTLVQIKSSIAVRVFVVCATPRSRFFFFALPPLVRKQAEILCVRCKVPRCYRKTEHKTRSPTSLPPPVPFIQIWCPYHPYCNEAGLEVVHLMANPTLSMAARHAPPGKGTECHHSSAASRRHADQAAMVVSLSHTPPRPLLHADLLACLAYPEAFWAAT